MASASPVLIFPRASLEQSAITAQRQRANKAAQALARGSSTINNLTARLLRPTDFNNTQVPTGANILARLSNPVALVANTYATDVFPNCTPGQNQGIVLTHFTVFSAVPFIDEVTVYVGALKVAVFTLEELYAQGGAQSKVGYLFDPIMVPPTNHLRIDLLSSVPLAIGAEQFGLGGYIGEIVGYTVNLQDNNEDDLVAQFDAGNRVPS
ncbi:MAG: hypothetical protein ABSH07_12855 [Candidatus Dormibacteria bacterium]|jgi:hypothetical protein